MNNQADMWVEFAKSFGMLFVVLAFFLVALYLVRRFSGRFGSRGTAELIKVLSVHHLSPKEKLVLVSVLDESVLIGVSPGGISSLGRFDAVSSAGCDPGVSDKPSGTTKFQNLLKKSLVKGGSSRQSDDANSGKGGPA